MNQFTKVLLIMVLLIFVYFLMISIQEMTDYSKAGEMFNILILFLTVLIMRSIWIAGSGRKKNNKKRRF